MALYETLYANLSRGIPSITTLSRELNVYALEEGVLRTDDLKDFIVNRNLPKYIWISEDGTKITRKIQYNPKTNKLVGFVLPYVDGKPNGDGLTATSAAKIHEMFENEIKADYPYLVMAQAPVDKSPSFCMCTFGTDNRFTSTDVTERWKKIRQETAKHGIEVLGFSTDGDTRCLKSMRQLAFFNVPDESSPWPWFQMKLDVGDICIQDTVHIGTKLRTRLLKSNIVFPFGEYQVSVTHLQDLLENVPKDQLQVT